MLLIIDMIKQILDNVFAYRVDGDVFFSVEKFPEYGQLSGRKLEDNWAGKGVAVDSRKKNPADFALWKVRELYHLLALRLFLIGTHCRSPINYLVVQLETASERVFYVYQTLHDCESVLRQQAVMEKDLVPTDTIKSIDEFRNDFLASMSDDLDTPFVLAALSDPLKTINKLLRTCKGKKQAMRIESLVALEKIIRNVLSVLGLMPTSYSEVLQQLREKALKRAKLTEDHVLLKIEERNVARKNKDYEKSDAIRKHLADVGIALMEGPEGTTWRPAVPLILQEQQVATT